MNRIATLVSCEGEHSYLWDINESMRAAQTPEWATAAAALVPDAAGARVLSKSHIVVQHSEVDTTGTEFEVFAIQNGLQKRTALWRSHAFLDKDGSDFSRPTAFKDHRSSGLTIDEELAITWGQDGRIRLHDAEAGELAEFHSFNERSVTSFALTSISHPELGLEASGKHEVVMLCTTEDGLWCVLPERALTFKVEVSGSASATDETPYPAILYHTSGGTVFLAQGLQISCLDVAALMLGSANVFNSIGLDPILKQMDGNGTLIAVRAVDMNRVVLFLEFRPEQRDAESEGKEQKPTQLTLLVIDLSNRSAVSWASTENVLRVTEIDNAKFLLEYIDGQFAEAQCGPDTVSIQNLPAKTAIDFAVDTLWCLHLPANRYERRLTTMELPISEANSCNIRVEGGSVDNLILLHDRICAQRDGKEVGRWFAPGSYSLLDFNATQGRILVRGESQRLQVVDLATKKQGASEDLQEVLAGILERASYLMQVGRPDIARNRLMGILFSRPNLLNLSRASLLMAEIQCRSGLFEEAVSILQTLIEDLAKGDEIDEDVRIFVQKELNVLSVRAGFSRLQSDEEKKNFFDNLIGMWPDFNVFVAILAEALEGCLVVDKTGRAIGESMLNEIRRRTPDAIELASVNKKALQFLDTLLARITNAEHIASDEEIDWHAEVPEFLHSVLDQALGGSADSQLDLGTTFGLGKGVKRNPLRALYWYEKAAAQGSATAALNISQMYRHCEGVPRDLETAVKYLRLAAKAGNTFAKTNLAMMLLQGEGCERDVAAARELLIEAHNEGDDLATINLASVEAFGFGFKPNPSQGIELLTPLVRRGNARAMAVLSMILKSNS